MAPQEGEKLDGDQLEAEKRVGITEFIRPDLPGFRGILKQRYHDFVVNEITPAGDVVQLNSVNAATTSKSDQDQISEKPTPDNIPSEEQATVEQPKTASLAPSKEQEQTSEQAASETAAVPKQDDSQPANQATTFDEASIPSNNENGVIEKPPAAAAWQTYASARSFECTEAEKTSLRRFMDDSKIEEISALVARIMQSPHRTQAQYGSVTIEAITDRDDRTMLHQEIRRIFSDRVETETQNATNKIIVQSASSGGRHNARDRRGKEKSGRKQGRDKNAQGKTQSWQELGGEHLHFTMVKENRDTMECAHLLARILKLPTKTFYFAGTKDRRAVTTQRVSAHRLRAERLVGQIKPIRGLVFGDYSYHAHSLKLGDLSGNEFNVTLRDCQFAADEEGNPMTLSKATEAIRVAAENLETNGFINYFGMQRFGSFDPPTDTIGTALLKEDFEAAVSAILHYDQKYLTGEDGVVPPFARDDRERAEALHKFKTGAGIPQVLRSLPSRFSAEVSILKILNDEKRKNDWRGALQSISRALRLMYVHSYQSRVWNLAASYRWKLAGPKVVVGDLVLESTESKPPEPVPTVDQDGEVVISATVDSDSVEDPFQKARPLTQEDVDSGKFTIHDIVLPMPGFDVLYPEKLVKFYEDTMGSEDFGGLDPHNMRRSWKEISLSGSYRKLTARPLAPIEVDLKTYTNDEQQFITTAIDRFGSRSFNRKPQSKDETKETDANDATPEEGDFAQEQGKTEASEVSNDSTTVKVAVVLKLQLGTSQYATIALRELMKSGGMTVYKPVIVGEKVAEESAEKA